MITSCDVRLQYLNIQISAKSPDMICACCLAIAKACADSHKKMLAATVSIELQDEEFEEQRMLLDASYARCARPVLDALHTLAPHWQVVCTDMYWYLIYLFHVLRRSNKRHWYLYVVCVACFDLADDLGELPSWKISGHADLFQKRFDLITVWWHRRSTPLRVGALNHSLSTAHRTAMDRGTATVPWWCHDGAMMRMLEIQMMSCLNVRCPTLLIHWCTRCTRCTWCTWCTWCTQLAADMLFSRSKPTYARQLLDQAAVRDTENVPGIVALTTDFPLDF